MIAARIEVGEDHTHINLLTWTKAHRELILSANVLSSDTFLNGKFALENFLASRTFFKLV